MPTRAGAASGFRQAVQGQNVSMADYSDFAQLKENVWRAAIDKTMELNNFEGDSRSGFSSSSWCIFVDDHGSKIPPVGGSYGKIEICLATPYGLGPLQDFDVNKTVYEPWKQNIEDAFQGWEDLPDPADFDALITPLRTIVSSMTVTTGDTQSGGSTTGSKSLVGDLSAIRSGLDPHLADPVSGIAIQTFIENYGPDVMELVIGNLRQAVIVLGLAQTGGKSLWEKARNDIAQLAVDAADAFKGVTPPNVDFGICKAFLGLVGAFYPPAAAVTGAGAAVLDFVEAVKPPEEPPKVKPELKGGSPDEVLTHVVDSIRALNNGVWDQERELHSMLKKMFDMANGSPDDFTLYTKSGVNPEVKSMGVINVDTGLMKNIGFKLMPEIAAQLGSAVPNLETADSSLPWMRPWNIGYGSTGPWDEYFYLNLLTSGAISSLANQVVGAGNALAAAAKFLKDTDGLSTKSLNQLHHDVTDPATGWPKVDDDPPDYYKLPSGKIIPI